MEYKNTVMLKYKNPIFKKNVKNYNLNLQDINKACGDMLYFYVFLDDNIIKDIGYQGDGCSVAIYTAEVLCNKILEKNLDDAKNILQDIKKIFNFDESISLKDKYPDLSFLTEYVNRINCAKLSCDILTKIFQNA